MSTDKHTGAVECPACKKPKHVMVVFVGPLGEFSVCVACYLADLKRSAPAP